MSEQDSGFLIEGADNVEAYTLIGLRIRLGRKARGGLEMFSNGPSALAQANHVMGTKYRTALKAYPAFDKWLVAKYPGRVDPKPLRD